MANQSAVLLIVTSLIAAIPFHDLFSSCVYLYSYPLPWLTGRLPKQLFVRQLPPQPIPSADLLAALISVGSDEMSIWMSSKSTSSQQTPGPSPDETLMGKFEPPGLYP